MSASERHDLTHAAELRHAFDRSFAEALPAAPAEALDLLALGVAGNPYAIRLSEISGLFADRTLTALPGPVSELIGIGGFRGAIIPVYDLGALLGHPRAASHRWIVLARGARRVGFAFEQFAGHLRVPRAAIARAETPLEGAARAREVVRVSEVTRTLLDIPSLLERLEHLARQGAG